MSPRLVLSTEEITELTGRRRRQSQVEVLRFMGIEHRTRPDGTIAVLRSHVEHLLGGVSGATVERTIEPDWSAVSP